MTTAKIMLQKYGLRVDQIKANPVNDNGVHVNVLVIFSLVSIINRTLEKMQEFSLSCPEDERLTELAMIIHDGMDEVNGFYDADT